MKDIRELEGFWCDDITFCQEQCDWTICPRNKRNIRDHSIPHSFSVETPTDCPKKAEKSVKKETVEIVRCMNCKHGKPFQTMFGTVSISCKRLKAIVNPEWFCADGE